MSNPAVINLAETETSAGFFRVEDNIGESVHLHLGELRYDLTVKEFIRFSDDLRNVVDDFLKIPNFSVRDFSTEFLSRWGDALPDLQEIRIDHIFLEDLIVDTVGIFGWAVKKRLPHSRIVKALKGDTRENDSRIERNTFGQTNQNRLDNICDSIKEYGYPRNNQYIVLFNNNNMIMDGQHRAGCLYYLKGNIQIPVVRMMFKDDKYSDNSRPVIAKLTKWNKKRIKRIVRKIYYGGYNIAYWINRKRISALIRVDIIRFKNSNR